MYNEEYLNILFDYQPEEKPVRYYSNGDPGSPGHPEEIEINEVMYKGVDIYPVISYDMLEDIEKLLKED